MTDQRKNRSGAELLREAAAKMRKDFTHMAGLGDELSIFVMSVAELLDYHADCSHLWRHLSESETADAVARAYLGEA